MSEPLEIRTNPWARAARFLGIFAVFVIGAWSEYMGYFDFALENPGEIRRLTVQHIQLVAYSSAIAIFLGIPIGVFVTRGFMRRYRNITLNLLGICQTVPSLAIIAIAMGFMGIGRTTAIFGLVIYSILPIIRNTVAGILDVDKNLLDAGRGMGMTNMQILFQVEIPNAMYIILAGVRTSTVVNVGTAAVAFLIGGGGLGDLIFTGIGMVDTGLMLAGAIPTALLAISVNWFWGQAERIIISKGLIKT